MSYPPIARIAKKPDELHHTPESLLALQELWYGKAKEAGFSDIELYQPDYGEFRSELRRKAQSVKAKWTKNQHEANKFYEAAAQILWTDFFTPQEQEIWFLFCEGVSRRKAAKQLNLSPWTIRMCYEKGSQHVFELYGLDYMYRPQPKRERSDG